MRTVGRTGGRSCPRRSRLLLPATLATAGALMATACSDASPAAAPTTTSTVVIAGPIVPDDGVLTIGVVAPSVGDGAVIGRSVIEGARLAVSDINAAGGVADSSVRLIIGEEGLSSSEATTSIKELQQAGVDAIVGPTSSTVTLSTLGQIVDLGLPSCSPTASTMGLDDFPDRDLFFRTMSSDSLQAVAIAAEVERTGTDRAAVTFIDDAYGRPFGEAVRAALLQRGISVAVAQPFRTDAETPGLVAEAIAADAAGAVVVIAAASDGAVMLQALADAEGDVAPTYVINGAQESGAGTVATPTDFLSRVRVVTPAATGVSPDLDRRLRLTAPDSPGYYALQAYDCVTLIAIAAQTGAGQRTAIASGMVGSSFGGSNCATFAQCAAVVATGRNADYDGPGGLLSLRNTGDAATGQFVVYGFAASGRLTELNRFTATY